MTRFFSLQIVLSAILAFMLPTAAAEKILLQNASLIDVQTGRVLNDRSILIEEGVIKTIGADRLAGTPDAIGADRIDLKGAFILPGLSDAHVHITRFANMQGLRRLTVSVPKSAIIGVNNAEKTLMAGFTTIRNLGAEGYADVALMQAIDEGLVAGPRIIASGPSLGITGGHCDSNLLPPRFEHSKEGVADGPWAVREKVRQNVKYGATVIKFCGTGGVLSKGTRLGAQQFTLEEMRAIVDEAHLLGLKVAVHAHGTDGIATALEAGVDSVEHASIISDESIDAAVEAGAHLSMDIYVSDYILSIGEEAGFLPESLDKERQIGRLQRERFQAAHEAGAKIAFGTDAGVYPHGTNAKQFAKMVEWGMSPLEAIQAATINNADLFGLSDQIGDIAVGKAADIIATDMNPLQDITALEDVGFVMKSGKVFKNEINP